MGVATDCDPLVPSFFEAGQQWSFVSAEKVAARELFGLCATRPGGRQGKCQEREQDILKPNGFSLRLRRAMARLVEVRGRPVSVDRPRVVRVRGRRRDPVMERVCGGHDE